MSGRRFVVEFRKPEPNEMMLRSDGGKWRYASGDEGQAWVVVDDSWQTADFDLAKHVRELVANNPALEFLMGGNR